jgi:hypothetical protein
LSTKVPTTNSLTPHECWSGESLSLLTLQVQLMLDITNILLDHAPSSLTTSDELVLFERTSDEVDFPQTLTPNCARELVGSRHQKFWKDDVLVFTLVGFCTARFFAMSELASKSDLLKSRDLDDLPADAESLDHGGDDHDPIKVPTEKCD